MDNRQTDLSNYRVKEAKDSLLVAENCLKDVESYLKLARVQ